GSARAVPRLLPRKGGSRRASAAGSQGPRPRGSGSSRSRRPGTRASAARRPPRSSAVARAPVPARRSLQERQPVLADLELVAVVELPGFDAPAVEECPVEAAEVLDREGVGAPTDDRVAPRDGHVVQEDVAVRRPSDRRLLVVEDERLPRATAAGAHDER